MKNNVHQFSQFLSARGESRSHEVLPVNLLSSHLSLFLMDLRNKDGSEYEPSTIVGYSSSIRKHLSEIRGDIIAEKDFPLAHSTTMAKTKDLKSQGLGNLPNKSDPLTREHEQQLW